MLLKVIVSVVLAGALLQVSAYSVKKCKKRMEHDGIIPTFIPDGVPYYRIMVEFGNSTRERVKCGNIFNISSVEEAPFVKLFPQVRCKYLTLLIADADNLDGPPFLHLLIHDVSAADMRKGIDTSQEYDGTAASYMKPTPAGSGSYRILIFLYCQDNLLHAEKDKYLTYDSRLNFNLTTEGRLYDFGFPVGANFFFLDYEMTEPLP